LLTFLNILIRFTGEVSSALNTLHFADVVLDLLELHLRAAVDLLVRAVAVVLPREHGQLVLDAVVLVVGVRLAAIIAPAIVIVELVLLNTLRAHLVISLPLVVSTLNLNALLPRVECRV
jgi:hypothetical protein